MNDDIIRMAQEQEQEPVANNPDPYHLSRILHELAGSASMCWEHVDRAGVFQSTQAANFVAAALAEIRQRMKDAPPRREPLSVTELQQALVDVGLVDPDAVDDPDGYDAGSTVSRIDALHKQLTEGQA